MKPSAQRRSLRNQVFNKHEQLGGGKECCGEGVFILRGTREVFVSGHVKVLTSSCIEGLKDEVRRDRV